MRGRPLWLSLAVLLLAGAGLSWLQRDGDAPQEEVPQASGGETAAELTLPLNWQLTASSERALFQRLDQADRLWRPRLERLPGGGSASPIGAGPARSPCPQRNCVS